jgi:hypothetical protein
MSAGALTKLAIYVNQLINDAGIRTDLLSSLGSRKITYRPGDVTSTSTVDQTVEIKLDGNRDLSDFKGFVGDGVNDDSDAYERAVNWQISKTKYWKPMIGAGEPSTVVVTPGLTIPKGARVKLTRTMPTAVFLRANGFASIEAGPNVDMIVGNLSYRAHYENIYFIGGLTQVHLNNKNVNFGLWMFRNCTFVGSNDYAVNLHNTATDYGVTSTQAIFENCRWSRCRRSLFTECDHTFISGGWMQPYSDWFDLDTAVIKHVGLLTISDIMLVPSGVFGPRCRWVDSFGGIRLTKVRFGGENGGLPGVYWFAAPPRFTTGTDTSIEVGVIYDACTNYFGAQDRPDRGGIVLQGHMPRIVRYTNCTGPIAGRLIHNDPLDGGIPDITDYIAVRKTLWNGVDMHQAFSFHYTGDGMKIDPGSPLWPAELDTYSYTDKGRVIEPRVHRTDPGTTIPHNSATRMSFDGATVDPYKCGVVSSGATVINTPLRASFARVICNLQGNNVPANGQRYIAQLFVAGLATNVVAYYDHVKDGPPRFSFTGAFVVVPGNDIDVRITQVSGVPATFTGTMTVDFDVRQF